MTSSFSSFSPVSHIYEQFSKKDFVTIEWHSFSKYLFQTIVMLIFNLCFIICTYTTRRSQQSRGLRRRSAAARLLILWVRIPPGAWMSVCCECCVLSGRGLCDELIIRPEESYRLWCVVVCDLETSWMRRPRPTGGCRAKNKQKQNIHNPAVEIWTMTLWKRQFPEHREICTSFWIDDFVESERGALPDLPLSVFWHNVLIWLLFIWKFLFVSFFHA